MSKTRCTTVTVRKERKVFIETQLETVAFFTISVLQELAEVAHTDTKAKTGPRQLILAMRSENEAFNIFYNSLTAKFPHVNRILEMVCEITIDLLDFSAFVKKQDGNYFNSPIRVYYEAALLAMFEQPRLLSREEMLPEDIVFFKTEMSSKFIAKNIVLDLPKVAFSPPTCEETSDTEEDVNLRPYRLSSENIPSLRVAI
jgi:hypothetical protein